MVLLCVVHTSSWIQLYVMQLYEPQGCTCMHGVVGSGYADHAIERLKTARTVVHADLQTCVLRIACSMEVYAESYLSAALNWCVNMTPRLLLGLRSVSFSNGLSWRNVYRYVFKTQLVIASWYQWLLHVVGGPTVKSKTRRWRYWHIRHELVLMSAQLIMNILVISRQRFSNPIIFVYTRDWWVVTFIN